MRNIIVRVNIRINMTIKKISWSDGALDAIDFSDNSLQNMTVNSVKTINK